MILSLDTLYKSFLGAKKAAGGLFVAKREIVTSWLKTGIPERFWLLLFLLGVTCGYGIKSMAVQTFTLGFEDYRVVKNQSALDLNKSQDVALARGSLLTQPEASKDYPNCSINE